jgi:hypothetical protein
MREGAVEVIREIRREVSAELEVEAMVAVLE